ncbi:DUF928 domain-containing protein [Okeania sp. SIO2B3]|uniref:DUF928 domain-containing protein n=1 Tax=Okeania sp. SIO2B3 TaxID=2607784 RepID=UPI0013C275E8|nr:DUF928 domain-containing protein [Okeania sp. SIO2B3]NET46417.1 DUF928 domain-containing protein [Okeania sp. SIO2B3]
MEKIDIYAENGLWHETITELGNSRRSNPDDTAIAARWNSLGTKFEAEAIAAMLNIKFFCLKKCQFFSFLSCIKLVFWDDYGRKISLIIFPTTSSIIPISPVSCLPLLGGVRGGLSPVSSPY